MPFSSRFYCGIKRDRLALSWFVVFGSMLYAGDLPSVARRAKDGLYVGDMQKDFKIGLAIGVTLAAGAVLWLATLPNLSAKARALQAASGLDRKNYQPAAGQIEGVSFSPNPSPQTPPIASSPATSQMPSDSRTASDEPLPKGTPHGGVTPAPPAPAIRWSGSKAEGNTEPTQRIHIVQKGDTLSSISAKYYGSARQWRKIVAANRTNLPDPNHLVPGAKLVIPE